MTTLEPNAVKKLESRCGRQFMVSEVESTRYERGNMCKATKHEYRKDGILIYPILRSRGKADIHQ